MIGGGSRFARPDKSVFTSENSPNRKYYEGLFRSSFHSSQDPHCLNKSVKFAIRIDRKGRKPLLIRPVCREGRLGGFDPPLFLNYIIHMILYGTYVSHTRLNENDPRCLKILLEAPSHKEAKWALPLILI